MSTLLFLSSNILLSLIIYLVIEVVLIAAIIMLGIMASYKKLAKTVSKMN